MFSFSGGGESERGRVDSMMSGFSELSGTARTERTSVAGSADVAGQLLGLTQAQR